MTPRSEISTPESRRKSQKKSSTFFAGHWLVRKTSPSILSPAARTGNATVARIGFWAGRRWLNFMNCKCFETLRRCSLMMVLEANNNEKTPRVRAEEKPRKKGNLAGHRPRVVYGWLVGTTTTPKSEEGREKLWKSVCWKAKQHPSSTVEHSLENRKWKHYHLSKSKQMSSRGRVTGVAAAASGLIGWECRIWCYQCP